MSRDAYLIVAWHASQAVGKATHKQWLSRTRRYRGTKVCHRYFKIYLLSKTLISSWRLIMNLSDFDMKRPFNSCDGILNSTAVVNSSKIVNIRFQFQLILAKLTWHLPTSLNSAMTYIYDYTVTGFQTKYRKAKYRIVRHRTQDIESKISKSQPIETAEYRSCQTDSHKYRMRKKSETQYIVSHNIEWRNIDHAKFRRIKYQMQNIELCYMERRISKTTYRRADILNAKKGKKAYRKQNI